MTEIAISVPCKTIATKYRTSIASLVQKPPVPSAVVRGSELRAGLARPHCSSCIQKALERSYARHSHASPPTANGKKEIDVCSDFEINNESERS